MTEKGMESEQPAFGSIRGVRFAVYRHGCAEGFLGLGRAVLERRANGFLLPQTARSYFGGRPFLLAADDVFLGETL